MKIVGRLTLLSWISTGVSARVKPASVSGGGSEERWEDLRGEGVDERLLPAIDVVQIQVAEPQLHILGQPVHVPLEAGGHAHVALQILGLDRARQLLELGGAAQ